MIQTNCAFGRREKARGVDGVLPETGDRAPEGLARVVVGFLRNLFDLLSMQAWDTRDMGGVSRGEVVPLVMFFLAVVCGAIVLSVTVMMVWMVLMMVMMVMMKMRSSR